MWTAVLDLLGWLLGLLKPSTPDPATQGEKLGKAEQASTDEQAELKDVQVAKDARAAVRDAPASSLRDDDGFKRPGA